MVRGDLVVVTIGSLLSVAAPNWAARWRRLPSHRHDVADESDTAAISLQASPGSSVIRVTLPPALIVGALFLTDATAADEHTEGAQELLVRYGEQTGSMEKPEFYGLDRISWATPVRRCARVAGPCRGAGHGHVRTASYECSDRLGNHGARWLPVPCESYAAGAKRSPISVFSALRRHTRRRRNQKSRACGGSITQTRAWERSPCLESGCVDVSTMMSIMSKAVRRSSQRSSGQPARQLDMAG